MRQASLIISLLLVLGSIGSPVLAKGDMPITVNVTQPAAGQAKVVVKFDQKATDVSVSVNGTGAVQTTAQNRAQATVAKDGTIVFEVPFTAEGDFGGLAIQVRANFGRGRELQTVASTLVGSASEKTSGIRAKSGQARNGVIVVPSKTTVRP